MKTRFFAFAAIAVLSLNLVGSAFMDTRSVKAKQREASRLIALLPASDGVAIFDARRFFDQSLPTILSANQPMLGEAMAKLAEMQSRVGIDPRKFNQAAVGVNFKEVSATEIDYDTVALLSGDVNFNALIAAAKLASKGEFRTQQVGDRSIFIFTFSEIIKQHAAKPSNSKIGKMIDRLSHSFSKEIALASIDGKTLAVGSLARVRETLEANSRVSSTLTGLLAGKESSICRFAMDPKGRISHIITYGAFLGTNADAIQFLAGSFDIGAGAATLHMIAKTDSPNGAVGLKEMVEAAQVLGGIIANPKRPDMMAYSRMLENLKVTVRGNDVALDLMVPQADIDVLVASIK